MKKTWFEQLAFGLLISISVAVSTPAAVLYVDLNCAAPTTPYATWDKAATNIQDAIDAAMDGDQIFVTNGIYQAGGKVMAGDLTNRVTLDKSVMVQSVNGPWRTVIQGAGATNGPAAVRCAWLTNGAALVGFTLTGGATRSTGDQTNLESGGGVWCASSNAFVGNCLIVSNTAYQYGGGVYQGTVNSSLISSNGGFSPAGGAAYKTVLNNCTIVSNANCGVVSPVALTNCIIYYNVPLNCYGIGGNAFSHCCSTPSLTGTANITSPPQFLANGVYLATNSPCIGAGINIAGGTDIFCMAWSNPPSMGCAEWSSTPLIVSPPAAQFPLTGGVAIGVTVGGQPPFVCWWSKDGVPIQNDGHYSSANTTALSINTVGLSDAGGYQVVVSNSFGMATSVVSQVSVHCVATAGTPQRPYSDWTTAATNIQDAITFAQPGDIILVTNGIYAFGGKVMAGDLTNRVTLDKAVMVQSVNGPWWTVIQGAGATNGPAAVRCAWLTNGAALVGFTLTGGATRSTGDQTSLESGGGVWCASSNAFVGNCLIVSNTAYQYGGGVNQGTVNSSLIRSNGTTILSGGATYQSVLNNCTIVSNPGYGVLLPIAMTNCIIYFNNASAGNCIANGNAFSHCCTTPALAGTGNFTNAPLFFADGVHLASNSPCIGSGISIINGHDIFGNVWSNPPSIGCAEWQLSPVVTLPQIQLSGVPIGFTIGNLSVGGSSPCSFAWLKDGSPLQDNGHFSSTQTANLTAIGMSLSDVGNYQVVVSNSFGVVTSAVAQLVIHCVDVAGANPVAPYWGWGTAATNIQDAITASAPGDVVLVTNGLYAVGGKSMDGVITNRISVDKAIFVQSVNGPTATIIQGARDSTATNGPGAVRCAWLTNNAVLSGFTLCGGATRGVKSSPNQTIEGGGVFGTSSNNASVYNCFIVTNYAYYNGGGAFQVTLNQCTLTGNHAVGSGIVGAGDPTGGCGGGAADCNLKNCLLTLNVANQGSGGGADTCNLQNCLLAKNQAGLYGSGAYLGTLVNCTVTGNGNIPSSYSSYGGAVASATLTNCIVYGNYHVGSGPTNYTACTFSYSDTDPLPSGTGNMDVDPQLLSDGGHLVAASPCIGAGTASVVSGTDIDGQAWNNPPAIGCDEWQPAPVIGTQPYDLVNPSAHSLTLNVVVAGQPPFFFFWSKDGTLIQDDAHYRNSGTANLIVNNLGPDDAGCYQVVISNAFGVVTSAVAQAIIHTVAAAGLDPQPPFSTWTTAATNIQDAINVAGVGDIILVTNGLYATGGKVTAGDLTNRVALDKAVTVMSVNGWAATVIQGVQDPAGTNGPGAVRCAYLANGAVLNGFTLRNGATRATGDAITLQSGGGVCCSYSTNGINGIVSDCVLSNNAAIYGGGVSFGALNNCLVFFNLATYGGGAYYSTLNNCTVVNNYTTTSFLYRGAGTCSSIVRNSIVVWNYDNYPFGITEDNYSTGSQFSTYSYSCTSPAKSGAGNINVNPQFLDYSHIASASPCRGAGSAAYVSGTDLDGEAWADPPSMGCDEVFESNLVGPLSAGIIASQTNVLVNRLGGFTGAFTGRASQVEWSFGDGLTITNSGSWVSHQWTNSGDYTVTFTAYNNDNPAGVSTSTAIHVLPLSVPQLQSSVLLTNGFQFQFISQTCANYTVQYATNLTPPVTWQTLKTILYSSGGVLPITDATATNETRFYRVLAQ